MKKALLPLCILLAVLILVITMTTVSFSWFEPDVQSGVGLQFKETTTLRSESCTIKTYKGVKITDSTSTKYGLVDYETTEVANGTAQIIKEGETVYFKTVVENTSEDYDTNVSLFLKTFTVNSNIASVGVAVPTNSYRTFSSNQNDLSIVRNAFVKKYVKTDSAPGELSIEWFVKCDSGQVSFYPRDLYLAYN